MGRKDYKTAYKLFLPLAEQGNAFAQALLGAMYFKVTRPPKSSPNVKLIKTIW